MAVKGSLRVLGTFFIAFLFSIFLTSCGGGGESTSTGTSTTLRGQALLGPLSGASIGISTIDGDLVAFGTTKNSSSMADAGSFSFNIPATSAANIYLITVYGGTDIDPTDSGTSGTGVSSKGTVHAYVTAAQVKAGKIIVNPLTEIIYQDIALQYPNGVTKLTDAQWTSLLNSEAMKFLKGATSYSDVLSFIPSENKANSKIAWSKMLSKLVKGIHDGASEASMFNRVQILDTSLLPTGITSGKDGNIIEKLADVGNDRVETDIARNNTGQVGLLQQNYIDDSGAVVRVSVTRMSNTQSYLNATISKDGHTLGFKGSTTLLNDVDFSTANIAKFVSKLISISAPDATSLDITLDKSLSKHISDNELVFTIDGREPTREELSVTKDDPTVQWYWSVTTKQQVEKTAYDFKNKNFLYGITNMELLHNGTIVVEMTTGSYDNIFGQGNSDGIKTLIDYVGSFLKEQLVSAIATGLAGPAAPAALVPIGIINAAGAAISVGKLIYKSDVPSTGIMLVGNKDNKGRVLQQKEYVPILLVNNTSLSFLPSQIRNLSVEVRSFELSPSEGSPSEYDFDSSPESLQIGKISLRKDMGYVIIPPIQISFSMPWLYFSGDSYGVRLKTKLKTWDSETPTDVAVSPTSAIYPLFSYKHSIYANEALLDTSPTVFPKNVTTATYTWYAVVGAHKTQIGTEKEFNILNDIIDPKNTGYATIILHIEADTGQVADYAERIPLKYLVTGTITGLKLTKPYGMSQELELYTNLDHILSVPIYSNGTQLLIDDLPNGDSYAITVKHNPAGQTCTVSNGSGTIRGRDVNNVAISCADNYTNTPPVANAGTDQNITTGSLVTLDGSGSSDADNNPLSYSWSFTSKPERSSATLSDTTAVKPTFTADVDGSYVISLTVNDGTVNSTADSVTIIAVTGTASYPDHIIKTITVGSNPLDIAITSDGNYVYVANYGADTVSVIRTSDNSVIKTITVGGIGRSIDGKRRIAITPDSNYVYVANYGADTVSVIRTSDNSVIKTIAVDNHPADIAITPDGNYVYVSSSWGTVSVIRTSDNSVVKTITVGGTPLDIAITPDGNYVYVSSGWDTVSVIRTSDNSVVKTIPVGGMSLVPGTRRHIAITPDGNYVYVANFFGGTSVIRTSDNSVVKTNSYLGGTRGIAITPDSNYVYVANYGADTVSVIRTSDNSVVKTIPVAKYPFYMAITPDSNYVYVANYGSDTVSVIGK